MCLIGKANKKNAYLMEKQKEKKREKKKQIIK